MLFKFSVKGLYRIATCGLKEKGEHGVNGERGGAAREAQGGPCGAFEMFAIGHSLGAWVLRKGVVDSFVDGCGAGAESFGGANEGVGGVVL
jgi:hypothetical protein